MRWEQGQDFEQSLPVALGRVYADVEPALSKRACSALSSDTSMATAIRMNHEQLVDCLSEMFASG